jgi:hypothetical protein
MKHKLETILFLWMLTLPATSMGQTSVSPTIEVLQSSVTAMLGKVSLSDITLNGSSEAISGGSNSANGSFEFRATAAGSSRTDLILGNETITNIYLLGGATPSGSWTNGNGTQQPIAPHNLLAGVDWAFPPLLILNITGNPSMVVSYIGLEGNLIHLSASKQLAGAPSVVNASVGHLTQIDVWLNSSTLLPAKLSYNMHPDNNAAVDIPVTVQFTNYQTLSQILVPSQIQEYINNTLALTVQIQSANVNSGLSPTIFATQ